MATFTAVLGNKYIFSHHGDQTGPNLEGYPRDFHASYSTLLLKCNISVWASCWIVWIWRLFSRRKCTITAYAIILMWKCWEKTSYELNCTPSSQQFPSLSSLFSEVSFSTYIWSVNSSHIMEVMVVLASVEDHPHECCLVIISW